ncbi:MAG: DNA recombination protein RmuC [Nitrospinae bacterium]|nr:DNA recombination protein RmuC [Nitrospinota bacterium]
MESNMSGYGWLFPAVFAVLVGAVFFLLGRAAAGWRAGDDGNLQKILNERLMEQTQRLVETIGRAREESKDVIGTGLSHTQQKLSESLSQGRAELADRLEKTQKLLADRLENLVRETAEIKAASGRMLEIGGDIRNLSQILDGPKGRGGFGEFQLELMLKQAIPADRFALQYEVEAGRVADAAILFKDAVLCIDSKFPLANLQKHYDMKEPSPEKDKLLALFYADVKNRGREISKKYVVPPKTLGFAVMFIPAEAVFLEIISNSELHKALMDMRVVPASPNFLYVYFQALAIGFAGMAVEERAKEMLGALSELKVNFEKFQDTHATLGKHIMNASNMFGQSEKHVARISNTLENLRLGQSEPPPEAPNDKAQ